MNSIARLAHAFVFACLLVLGGAVQAQSTSTDWGAIPTSGETTISFSGIDKTKNFTDQYSFSIAASTDASYSVTVTFDFCANGCGNIEVGYGIYDANGGLISDTGSAVLSSGDYVFMVKGTGMGAGNDIGYNGSISFFVSPVPEASDYLMFVIGMLILMYAVRRHRQQQVLLAPVPGRMQCV